MPARSGSAQAKRFRCVVFRYFVTSLLPYLFASCPLYAEAAPVGWPSSALGPYSPGTGTPTNR